MNDKKVTPPRTVERLFLYVRFLKAKMAVGAENVFSHELSLAVGISPEQVRQDLMCLNIRGTPQRGYSIKPFLADLQDFLYMNIPVKAIIIGAGNLGKALMSHFSGARPNLQIVAAFEADSSKCGKNICGCPVKHISCLKTFIDDEHPLVGIIAVPPDGAQQLADDMAKSGIKAILNFAPVAIKSPPGVFLEQADMMLSLEKTVFFARAR